jgi:neutral ceramidase
MCLILACGGDDDAATPDAGPAPLSTAHCTYAPLPATARAGGTVTAGPLEAGAADIPLGLPVSSALGGNTSRVRAIENQSKVDGRSNAMSGGFNPSVGVETTPRIKALALSAGGETVVILRTDTIFSDDSITHDVADRLGPEYAGKVLWASTHSHTGPEQYHGDEKLQVGGGIIRRRSRDVLTDRLVMAAQAALAAREPARLGIAVTTDFDPENRVSYDRRPENDDLFGGAAKKDSFLAVIRVDRADGTPLAIVPIFGNHSAILDDDVALFSTDVSGMYEKHLEEQFDTPVVVLHLQGAGGDVLPESSRHVEVPDGELDMDFARSEENGRHALPELWALWQQAGEAMHDELALEMLTRSVALGPDWENFTVRDGALAYAPWDGTRVCDGRIFGAGGEVLSPIDEFNAPAGAGLCGDPEDETFAVAQMPGVAGLVPYHSCAMLPQVLDVLSAFVDVEFEAVPLCGGTRTTVSALRLGEYLVATAPGEPLVLWAQRLREVSPVAPEKTIVVGYAQGHVGYILNPEDWLRGGFEPTINLWGPLEGELLLERAAELLALAATPEREDAAAGGATRLVSPDLPDTLPPPDDAPQAGTVPATVPPTVYFRGRAQPATGQPAATIPRVTGVARFVWIGEDPLAGTPRVRLEREVGGAFVPVTRRSGRVVEDLDLIVTWTPDPLFKDPPTDRTHYWAVEWQAVTPFGVGAAPGSDELSDRAGLPLGRYRFHVEGSGYSVDSAPFDVVAGPLTVHATVQGDALQVDAAYEATEGWRLLAMTGLSNREVPITTGPLTVTVSFEAGPDEVFANLIPAGPGQVVVTPSTTAGVSQVRVTDRFGNSGVVIL